MIIGNRSVSEVSQFQCGWGFRCYLLSSWHSGTQEVISTCKCTCYKGLRPLPPTPADSRIFGFFDFSENVDFWIFPVGFGVWEGLQWIPNGCGLQIVGFSAHSDRYESIFDNFHDFDDFAFVSGRLTLFPEGPRALRDCLEGPRTL